MAAGTKPWKGTVRRWRVSVCLALGFPVRAKGAQQPNPRGAARACKHGGAAGWACSTSSKELGPWCQAETATAVREAPQPSLCTQISASCINPSAPKHTSAGITTT